MTRTISLASLLASLGTPLPALFAVTLSSIAHAQPLPDLVISDITIDSECRLGITVTNQGSGPVPQSAYQEPGGATIAFFNNGAPFGGWGLNSIDPQHTLMTPGASVTWLRPSPKLVGAAQISVTADAARNVIIESNEQNNSLARSFSCTPRLPDLRISQIDFTNDCRARLFIDNIGDDPVADSAFRSEGAYVQRYLDGEPAGRVQFGPLDQNRAMQPPGGNITWIDGSEYRASQTVKYALQDVGQEWNKNNNVMQVAVPPACQLAVQQPPDLVTSAIALDNNCRLVVTLTNNGPGPMPLSAYDPIHSPSINLYKNGAAFGGWGLNSIDPQQVLRTPGASVSWTRPLPAITGSVTIRVNLDAAQELSETNEANNDFTQVVHCGPAPEPEPEPEPAPTSTSGPPDLAITRISYGEKTCQPTVRLESLGGAPDSTMYRAGGVYLQRIEDGRRTARIPLLRVDTGSRLLRGQTVLYWTDTSPIRARRTVRYEINGVKGDTNVANNSDQASVPIRCGGSGLVPPRAVPRAVPRVPQRVPLYKH